MTMPDSKTCPECAEPVRMAARVCRFCRHEFAPGPTTPIEADAEQAGETTSAGDVIATIVGIVFLIAIAFGLHWAYDSYGPGAYQRGLDRVEQQYSDARSMPGSSDEDRKAKHEAFQKGTAQLEGLEPPEEVIEIHNSLVWSLSQADYYAEGVTNPDTPNPKQALTNWAKYSDAAIAAAAELEAAGYNIDVAGVNAP